MYIIYTYIKVLKNNVCYKVFLKAVRQKSEKKNNKNLRLYFHTVLKTKTT